MFANLGSEFRKLLSVRSTYYILLITFGLEVLVFWFAKGYKIDHKYALQVLGDSHFLNDQALMSVNLLSLIYCIVVVLLVTHEYRYNTIMYTLAASKTRSRVFAAKFIVISIFALVCGAVFAALAPLLTRLGLAASGHALVHQTFLLHVIVWRILFFSWGVAMFSGIISLIIRNQVGAFATVFLLPTTIENLLTLWLHDKNVYLPYTSLGTQLADTAPANMSYTHALFVSFAWIIGGLIVAWTLFLKRDAN